MILDTNALSALLDGDSIFHQRFAAVARWDIPCVVLGEFRFGLQGSRLRASLEKAVAALEVSERMLSVTPRTARHYAVIRHELRVAGRPIPANDTWIAALAREFDRPIVTRDEHFAAVDGLQAIGW